MKKIKFKKDILMFICSIVSAFIEGSAQTSFVIPGKFYPSGLAGLIRIISSLLEDYFPVAATYSILYFVSNLLLAIIVFKDIGKRFTIYTFIQTSFVSLFIKFLPPFFTISDSLLLAIFGGIINGLGVGIALANDLSSGGSDFLVVYFSKKYNRSILDYVFYINIFVILFAGISNGLEIAMYSIIYSYCSTQVVKNLHKRYTHETITIITKKPDEVINNIYSNVRHGITVINAKGGYMHQEEAILYTVVNSFQTSLVIKSVKEIDENAFINVQNSKKVVGNYYQLPLD